MLPSGDGSVSARPEQVNFDLQRILQGLEQKEVTISGTPQVTITNPPPRPNVNVQMSVVIHEAANADAVAQQLSQRVRSEMDGLQASTNDSGL